jgi:hypothetical protein
VEQQFFGGVKDFLRFFFDATKSSFLFRFFEGQLLFLLYLPYFIAIIQWSIGHQLSASIGGGFWLELVVRQNSAPPGGFGASPRSPSLRVPF